LIILSTLVRPDTQKELEAAGFLICPDPTRAVEVAAALIAFGRKKAHPVIPVAPPLTPAPTEPLTLSGPISESAAKILLAKAGLPVSDERSAGSAEQAIQAAEAVGLPVAMKLNSPQISHKTEIGGVMLDLGSPQDVGQAYETLMDRAQKSAPEAIIEGILVAPMIKSGVEVILGVKRDAIFGPVVMFGLGGIFVEVFKDVVFRLAPFDIDEAHKMIREIKGLSLLNGARGGPAADLPALASALVNLSSFAAAHIDAVDSIDINPMIVRPKGQGVVIVDAAIFPRLSAEQDQE
jgi:acyl-CoA synthetase (NDP forming)